MRIFLLLVLLEIFFLRGAFADSMLRAQVADAADVYAQPDFNAKVVEHLQSGTTVSISADKEIGASGMGVFYKVKTPSGKSGYITDSDILASSMAPIPAAPTPTPRRSRGYPSSFGPSLGLMDYAEKINGETKQGDQLFMGVRRIGSARRSGSIRSDINLMVSPFPPTFLGSLGAYGPAKGFLVQGDVSALWPFLAVGRNSASIELGPGFTFAKYSTTLASGPYDASQFRPALAAGLGYAYTFSSGVIRVDLKAFVESTPYFGPMASFQFNL